MFTMSSGVLYHTSKAHGMRPVAPHVFKDELLTQYHGNGLSGHLGRDKTHKAVQKAWYWTHMYEDVRAKIAGCAACARRKATPTKFRSVGNVWANEPFQLIACDFVGPIQETEDGHQYILTIVDMHSRWVEMYALRQATAHEVAECIYEYVTRHDRSRLPIPVEDD